MSAGAATGAVFVFGLVGGRWIQQAVIFAADAALHASFGVSVAAGSNTIVVGSLLANGESIIGFAVVHG